MRCRTHIGKRVSEIGLGCYGLSGAYGDKDPEGFIKVIRRAYDLGVTFFDTADVYGPGEHILGRAVAPFRDQVWVATKVGVSADGKPDCSAEQVLSSCEGSLRRLQTETIDLYQIHFDDPKAPIGETVGALETLKASGKILHYGMGHVPLPALRSYMGFGDVFSALVELSAVARGAREARLPLCQEHNVGVIAFSVTGRGLLTGEIGPGRVFEEGDIRRIDPLFQRERFASGLRVMGRIRALSEKYGRTPVQVAIAWVLAQPGVICALTGPSTIPHLEENLGGSGWDIAAEDMEALERFFDAEDKRVKREQVRDVRDILSQELDPRGAFADLIYAIETLVDSELAAEKEMLPLFQALWPLRRRRETAALGQMRQIQAQLRERFWPLITEP